MEHQKRHLEIDALRGLVMLLMAIDHTSFFLYTGHPQMESLIHFPSTPPHGALNFITRFISHLCAPTFLFLVGYSLSLSVAKRKSAGKSNRQIDQGLAIRGILLIVIDLWLISPFITRPLFQVLSVIGFSLIAMIPLRHLPIPIATSIGIILLFAGEYLTSLVWPRAGGAAPNVIQHLFAPHLSSNYIVIYPLLPWLSLALLGWSFGHRLHLKQIKTLLILSASCFLIFLGARYFNSYGNMFMPRQGDHVFHWLVMSKYPPSLAFICLQLSIMLGVFAISMKLVAKGVLQTSSTLVIYGQGALVFYVLHWLILRGLMQILNFRTPELWKIYLLALGLSLVCFPACSKIRTLKAKGTSPWLRYL